MVKRKEPDAYELAAQLDSFDKRSDAFGLVFRDASRAKQSFKEEADINTIVRRFGVTGELPSGVRVPSYGDFSGVSDFHSAMNVVAQANEAFDAMPAAVRKRFDHDPGKFLDFVADRKNLEEAARLGIVVPEALEKARDLAKGGSTTPPGKTSSGASGDDVKGDKGAAKPPAQSST